MKKILYRSLVNENLNVEIDVPEVITEEFEDTSAETNENLEDSQEDEGKPVETGKEVEEPSPVIGPDGAIVPQGENGDLTTEAAKEKTEFDLKKKFYSPFFISGSGPEKLADFLNGKMSDEMKRRYDTVIFKLKQDYENWKKEYDTYRDMYLSKPYREKKYSNPTVSWDFDPNHIRIFAKYEGFDQVKVYFSNGYGTINPGRKGAYPYWVAAYLKFSYLYNQILRDLGYVVKGPFSEGSMTRSGFSENMTAVLMLKSRAKLEGCINDYREEVKECWPEFPEDVKNDMKKEVDQKFTDPPRREDDPDFDPAVELEESNPAPIKKTTTVPNNKTSVEKKFSTGKNPGCKCGSCSCKK